MKIRSGFVSNSSSSSFICDVCGETQSGMDLCLSEAGMVRCSGDKHTFCESHQLVLNLSLEEKRQSLIVLILERKYYKPEENEVRADEFSKMSNAEIEEKFNEYNSEVLFPQYCPMCQLLDVTESDVARYFMIKNGFKTTKEVAAFLKNEFGNYQTFNDFLRPPKV